MEEDQEDFIEALEWFAGKENTEKAKILDEPSTLTEEELENFGIIIKNIREMLTSCSKEKAIENIKEYDILKSSFAVAFVEETVERAPPPELILRNIQDIGDEDYTFIMDKIIEGYKSNINEEKEIAEKIDSKEESLLNNFVSLIREYLILYLRGELSLNQIEDTLSSKGFDKEKTEYLARVFEENCDEIHNKLLFRNTQDILFEKIRNLEKKQEKTNELLEELLKVIKSSAKERGDWEAMMG